ncbi:hypothetical protein MFIFM68171_08144 [Madurella fahalii]|uniref:Ankyrin repeat protein n=1 Tax=Madurella fahalii TaxID=1157608 RepID=A0ABQ0GJJ4_9PEZI
MEILGAVASVVSLCEASKALGKACKRYVDSVKDAPDWARRIQHTVSSLEKNLGDILNLGEPRQGSSASFAGILAPGGEVKACEAVIINLKELIAKHLEDGHSSTAQGSWWGPLYAKAARLNVAWIEEAEDLHRELERLCKIIDRAVLMGTVHLASSTYRDVSKGVAPYRNHAPVIPKDAISWLAPRNYATDQREHIGKRTAKTCQWLVESDSYLKWRNEERGTLFCHGIAGSGKTVIAATVVEDIDRMVRQMPRPAIGIAYLYISHSHPDTDHTAECLLKNLLGQLARPLQQIEDALEQFNHVQRLYKLHGQHHSVTTPTWDEIVDAFHHIAKWYRHIFIVIDALDECRQPEERKKLLKKLCSLQSSSNLDLRIFATSRLDSWSQWVDGPGSNCRSVEIRAQSEDIKKYLEEEMVKLADHPAGAPELKEKIRSEVVKKADGVFLLARLFMNALNGQATRRSVERKLQSFGSGNDASETIDLAYKDTMERIGKQEKPLKVLALKALAWVTFATRPLTEVELRHALSVVADSKRPTDDDLPETDLIVKACYGLLGIDKKTSIFQLAHSTTKEYLEKSLGRDAKVAVAKACILYLCLPEFSHGPIQDIEWFGPGKVENLLRENPLLGYASSNWPHHLSQAEPSENERLLLMLSDSPGNLSLSFQVHLVKSRIHFSGGITAAHVVSYLGNSELVYTLHRKDLLRRDEADGDGKTALHWAVARRDDNAPDIVERLLGLKFDINYADVEGRTPLHWAAKLGDNRVVKVLLERGARTRSTDKAGNTPLIEACWSGHVDVVKQLLDRRAKINVRGRLGTPLVAAIMAESETCVDLLLKDGRQRIKKNIRTEYGTALHDAAHRGSPRIVEKLLDAGFDPNQNVDGSGTPLQAAVAGHHKQVRSRDGAAVVRLLVDRGADVNASGGRFGTALDAAKDNDSHDLEEFLRGRGAFKTNSPRATQESPSMAQADATQVGSSSLLLPPSLKSHTKHFINAILMGNERMIREHATLQISAFKEAVKLGNTTVIKTLSMVSTIAFIEMVNIARGDRGPGTQELPVNTFYKSHSKWCVALLMAMIASLVNLIMGIRTGNRKLARQHRPRLLHAADTASSKLELMTSAGLQILSDAIQNGDGDIVRMLSVSWVVALRHAFFPGDDSDKMMEMLVQCHAQEFEASFKDCDMEKAVLLANVGLELIAAAIQQRKSDIGLARLALDLSRIWSLTLNNLVERHLVDYAELEHFLRRLLRDFTAGFPKGDWKIITRLGPAMVEVLIGVVADKSPHVAHIVSQVITEGWQLAVDLGGEKVVHDVLLSELQHEFWRATTQMAGKHGEDVTGTRMWNMLGALLSVVHTAVKYNQRAAIEELCNLIFENVQRSYAHETIVGYALRGQVQRLLPRFYEVDSSPVYIVEVISTLLSAARRTAHPGANEFIRREVCGAFSEPSNALDDFFARTREFVSRRNWPEGADRVKAALKLFPESLNIRTTVLSVENAVSPESIEPN